MTRTTDEIAHLFDAIPDSGANYGAQIYPGYSGLVVAAGQARAMSWGFPLVLKGKQGQKLKPKPVNNARSDKLNSPFWKSSFQQRRCLIPVSAWAEAEGKKGQMTRTWYSLVEGDAFAVAGLWRATDEWGDAYSMVMVDGVPQMADVHDRMPVILARKDWPVWTEGESSEVMALCQSWTGTLKVDRTDERWAGGGSVPGQNQLI